MLPFPSVLLLSALALAAPDSTMPFMPPATLPAKAETVATHADSSAGVSPRTVDYLWVVRTALVRPEDVERIVDRALEMGVRGLLVQVVGRGDAFYRSDILPPAEVLTGALRAHPEFDPLAALLARAHASGLEVHAWMNCLLVWSAPGRPRDPRHVLNAHPEWEASLADGRRLSRVPLAERRRLKLEGIYLSAARPEVRTWIARVATEIVRRYPVDGIQLDYIRQPGVPVGFDPDTRARFALRTGVDPRRLRDLPAGERAPLDSAWASFQCEQVTAVVREVGDSLRAIRPGIALSAAVIADTLAARTRNAQAWTEWLRDRLLQRAFAMCYGPVVQNVLDQLVGFASTLGVGGQVVPGIAVYNTTPALAAAKILGARTLGFPLLALYSYDALEAQPGYWPSLRDRVLSAGTPDGRP